jgi:hypothetical protein
VPVRSLMVSSRAVDGSAPKGLQRCRRCSTCADPMRTAGIRGLIRSGRSSVTSAARIVPASHGAAICDAAVATACRRSALRRRQGLPSETIDDTCNRRTSISARSLTLTPGFASSPADGGVAARSLWTSAPFLAEVLSRPLAVTMWTACARRSSTWPTSSLVKVGLTEVALPTASATGGALMGVSAQVCPSARP